MSIQTEINAGSISYILRLRYRLIPDGEVVTTQDQVEGGQEIIFTTANYFVKDWFGFRYLKQLHM